MNVFSEHPFKVIMDYAHNAAAVEAICQLVERLDVQGRRIIVLAAPGDRRDEDIAETAKIAAGRFDQYICREDDGRRGRESGEIPRIVAAALKENGVADDAISVIPEEQQATQAALESAQPGDLVLLLADKIKRSWKQVVHFNEAERSTQKAGDAPAQPAPPPAPAETGSARRRKFRL